MKPQQVFIGSENETYPENWREVWNNRTSHYRCDSLESAEKWKAKLQAKIEDELKIDFHPKDGYVIYADKK